jgi:hypothetical protein
LTKQNQAQFENAYYHVTHRGNARKCIFSTDADRLAFLDLPALRMSAGRRNSPAGRWTIASAGSCMKTKEPIDIKSYFIIDE